VRLCAKMGLTRASRRRMGFMMDGSFQENHFYGFGDARY